MNIRFSITDKSIARLTASLFIIELLFVALFAIDYLFEHPSWQMCELFDLDRESNIPTWFSTLQLLFIGVTALVISSQSNYQVPPSRLAMTVFGCGFVYLSMDEAAAIHEKITYVFYDNPMVPYFEGVHGIWIVVYGSIGILLSLFFHKDIIAVFNTFRRESLIFIFGIIIYLAGAAGAETITFFQIDKSNPNIYTIEVIIEEFFEMAGATILLASILLCARKKLE